MVSVQKSYLLALRHSHDSQRVAIRFDSTPQFENPALAMFVRRCQSRKPQCWQSNFDLHPMAAT
jgi:HPt (histidine-containing phosphotransfer) domain-containing protein